ncbi:aldehyde dehydrogenase family protein [Gordonia rubripertincta]|jgi:aldehyde dehydrogenase (NAD+)|uniref:aldehyde dehydrogenase family protein n=1 Tax=Gordonia rubripertincta TaxID=36822 RepID=UPI000B8D6934|nr:aldehyde dehydrogenase family protein [Gordonia rubripertincta]ASR01204.1 Putative succinate-semialdehyde dehydrogenase [NADP(+)] 2 [Gordonia rubripertincta]
MTVTDQGAASKEAASVVPLQSVDVFTGAELAAFEVMTPSAVWDALTAARAAATTWSSLGFGARRTALLAWATELSRSQERITHLIHRENGKPVDDAFMELVISLEHIRWAAKNAAAVMRERRVSPGVLMANYRASVRREPFGVIGVISPWNYPLFAPIAPVASALAAGNTVLLKPSEFSTAVGTALVQAFRRANPGLPEGVLSVVSGYGATGAALVESGVDKIEFTGSPGTARRILASCAQTLTPVVMECGGKDALIVAPDADIDAAADAAAWGGFSNGGQTCVGVERVYVHESVADDFIAALARRLENAYAGGFDTATYGPMTVSSQVEVVSRHVQAAVEAGAQLPLGGLDRVRGRMIDPILLVDGDENNASVTEETFGPTVTVKRVRSVDEAIDLANAGEFGLGAAVFSRSDGDRIASRLTCGMASINSVLAFVSIPALPFGGVGSSGYGRIHGEEGIREFSRTKSVSSKRFDIPGMNGMLLSRAPVTMPALRLITHTRFALRNRKGIR